MAQTELFVEAHPASVSIGSRRHRCRLAGRLEARLYDRWSYGKTTHGLALAESSFLEGKSYGEPTL